MDKVIGTCSICGGPVTVTNPWMGLFPPIPHCNSCGAVPKQPHGPTIDMKKPDNIYQQINYKVQQNNFDMSHKPEKTRYGFGGLDDYTDIFGE